MSAAGGDDLLRRMVREVLRELIREELGAALAATPGSTSPSPAASSADAGGVHRIARGAVTERAVKAAAAAGARLEIGPRAVLTPLAKDRARALGVVIERTQEDRAC